MDRYEEALERAKEGKPMDEVFPELKESEGERIRREIIDFICWEINRGSVTKKQQEKSNSWLAYLEKQKYEYEVFEPIENTLEYKAGFKAGIESEKQKELERIVPEREATDFEIEVHEIIAQARSDNRLADKDVLEQFEQEAACALMWKAEKQLRNAEKQKEQKPNQEWSEEDEEMYARIVRRYTDYEGVIMRTKEESIAAKVLDAMAQEEVWLHKSLRPQSHWKPSEEQIKALNKVANEGALLDLFNDLLNLL